MGGLVGEEQWLEGESTIIQCAHGDAIAYPLAAIELEIQGKPVLVNASAAVSDTLQQSTLVGTDLPGLLEMLQTRNGTEEEKAEPWDRTLGESSGGDDEKSYPGQQTEGTTEPGI